MYVGGCRVLLGFSDGKFEATQPQLPEWGTCALGSYNDPLGWKKNVFRLLLIFLSFSCKISIVLAL